jgi:hypothetical protein
MCPFCVSTVALIVAGTVSTGGLATLAMKLSGKKSGSTEIIPNSNERSFQDVD